MTRLMYIKDLAVDPWTTSHSNLKTETTPKRYPTQFANFTILVPQLTMDDEYASHRLKGHSELTFNRAFASARLRADDQISTFSSLLPDMAYIFSIISRSAVRLLTRIRA
jgi:hypothetical protein